MILSNSFTHDSRVYNEAKALVNAGNKVTVLAWDAAGGNILCEKKDNIDVVRIVNTKLMNFLRQGLIILPLWRRQVYKNARVIHKAEKIDIIHCHDLDTLPVGIRLKKSLGVPLIYDAHEIWGYLMQETMPGIFRFLYLYFLWKEKKL